jgi:hypothetical protein
MMLKRSTTESKPSAAARLVRAGVASLAAIGAVAALVTGCLDRDVVPATPTTSNLFVDQIVQTSVDKIDLLFMVDNSVSMSDKQEILKDAVPVLVSRLITPICLNPDGTPSGTMGNCTGNTSPEFNPIGDIHIGIVSSSLGGHGTTTLPGCYDMQEQNDQAHLIGANRTTFSVAQTWNNSGFLAWDSSGKKDMPAGTSNAATFTMTFQDMIVAVGEHGCGYEAQLESWYRFLIDPEPPATVTLVNQQTVRSSHLVVDANNKLVLDANGRPTCMGCDDTLLAQRKAFLRPDSLVAIIMLSDENDCSIVDSGYGWFVGAMGRMPLATTACDANPNDPCCRSCAQGEDKPPAGCAALTADAHCMNVPPNASYAIWDMQHDSLNLRCYNQHQRFGFDLLYPTDRYVSALKNKSIYLQSNGNVVVANPLYDSAGTGKAPRDTSLVFLAGIVGVPWQDIADEASQTDPMGLTYLTAKELAAPDPKQGGKTRWDFLLGSPGASPPVPPADPFMVETPVARAAGTNPLATPPAAIAPPTSTMAHANAINGHEQNIPDLDDLQYACIFPLKTPRDCVAGDNACDCAPEKAGTSTKVTAANSPLCQGGTNINQQTSAKAYPGARELTVLRDFGDNAIVASICPKVADPKNPNYGYNPAVGAIIERLKEALKAKCLPRKLSPDATTGQVLCKVIEAQKQGCGKCDAPGRGPADPKILDAVRAQLAASGNCDVPGTVDNACKDWCQCEILQLTGKPLAACQLGQITDPGYCYVDKATNPTLISKCPPTQPQLLNFTTSAANPTPAPGAVAFIACLGAPT